MALETSQTIQKEYKGDIPLFWKIHYTIFTKNKPDLFTRMVFYIGLVIVLCFLFWHAMSLYVIENRDLILDNKNINVEQLIICRGEKLGFKSFSFLSKLVQFHLYSLIIWLTFLGSLILLWRKSNHSIYLFLGGFIAYFSVLFFVMNLRFFNEDTTFFDKIALSIFALVILMYFIFSKPAVPPSTID